MAPTEEIIIDDDGDEGVDPLEYNYSVTEVDNRVLFPRVDFGDQAEIVLLDDDVSSQVTTGEGGTLIQANLYLSSAVRSALFSHQLDTLIKAIKCRLCGFNSKSFVDWRIHCQNKHPTTPGYSVNLLPIPDQDLRSQGPVPCPTCHLEFPSLNQRNEHLSRIVRTVRLVCPQCHGQFSNLEEHVQREHQGLHQCGECGLETNQLIVHYHTLHNGFKSVLSELTLSCNGDGLTTESFEAIFETESRFLASEVKPSGANAEKETEKPRTIAPAPPKIPSQGGVDWKKGWGPTGVSRDVKESLARLKEDSKVRDKNNVEDYKKFSATGITPKTHDCEICGFQPYTKNRYRERQDHLVRVHFKERIDQLIPVQRDYDCPQAECTYRGKDRQDILRHYTGKHNVLKIWVQQFLEEQMASNKTITPSKPQETLTLLPIKPTPPPSSSDKGMTFAEMQAKAKEAELRNRLTSNQNQTSVPGQPGEDLQWKRSSKMTGADQLSWNQVVVTRTKDDEITTISDNGDPLAGVGQYADIIDEADVDDVIEVDPLGNNSSAENSDISFENRKYECEPCHMNFPTAKALELHSSICSSSSKDPLLPSPVASSMRQRILSNPGRTITITDTLASSLMSPREDNHPPPTTENQPPKKKAKRPPPQLVRIS
eukprot:TRINITY_DN2361_c0_g1_i1.p1 TRINITY_DN2361_c0_g1~~TRINITY_DN2361_c0_g1_i1.p1  ORF type:complete len:655 (-),score=100.54 TRINITY_DN2361_c0_g1_i1:229-2193(-)